MALPFFWAIYPVQPDFFFLVIVQAKSFLLNWAFDALTSGIKQLNAVGSTMLTSMQGLLGYYPHKITNGPLEGLNNKIKTMKRQAYGFLEN